MGELGLPVLPWNQVRTRQYATGRFQKSNLSICEEGLVELGIETGWMDGWMEVPLDSFAKIIFNLDSYIIIMDAASEISFAVLWHGRR